MKIKTHFFGKDCIIDRELKNRANLESVLKKNQINSKVNLFLKQVHGNEVVIIDSPEKIHKEQGLPAADALVTNLPEVLIAVISADCAPILFFDEENKIIAAAHAGWRGAKAGVVKNTVAAMKKLGAKKITALIGPTIQQDSYQVGPEFLDEFLQEDSANKKFFAADTESQRYKFNLPAYVEQKLHEAGVTEIKNSHLDTYSNEDKFFSYRRAKRDGADDCGRNVSSIVLN